MVSVFLLILVVILAYVVVESGATAYELTGLDRDTARFQSLSAFTGTGFTTRVANLVVDNRLRRRITMWLMMLGYAGTCTVVASLVSSLENTVGATLLNLLIMAIAGWLVWVTINRVGARFLGDPIRRFLAPRLTGDAVPHEELLLYKRGFGVTRIEIPRNSRVVGRALAELDLRADNVQILAVEEDNDVHPIPDPSWRFEEGQHLIVYGELKRVQVAFGPRR